MTPRRLPALLLAITAVAYGQAKVSPAIRDRAKNFSRPGWVVVDGRFAQPQGNFTLNELIRFDNSDNRFRILSNVTDRAEPLLRHNRIALVTLIGSDFAWRITRLPAAAKDAHASDPDRLLIAAVQDTVKPDEKIRLTKIDVQTAQQVVQAVFVRDFEVKLITIVFGKDFVELAVGLTEAHTDVLVRSTTARQLKIEHPTEVRDYLAPVMRQLSGGRSPLAPTAGDVYRAFPDLPLDPASEKAVRQILPRLANPEPAVRQKASTELMDLGPRGVQAAMKLDPNTLQPEAADRIAAFIATNTTDARPPDELRKDSEFLLDCLTDSDANVRAAAGKLVTPETNPEAK
jgi:hypothetical protein